MRTYIRIFLNLFMPIALIVALGSVVYFSFAYDFSKALKLGILSGVLLGFPLSLVASFILLLKKSKPAAQPSEHVVENQERQNKAVSSDNKTPSEQKLIVLMDKKLAFDVALYSILEQNLGDATAKEAQEKNTITLRTDHDTIQIVTTALTRHTAQILIKGIKSSQEFAKIISYIKEKEYAFLQ